MQTRQETCAGKELVKQSKLLFCRTFSPRDVCGTLTDSRAQYFSGGVACRIAHCVCFYLRLNFATPVVNLTLLALVSAETTFSSRSLQAFTLS